MEDPELGLVTQEVAILARLCHPNIVKVHTSVKHLMNWCFQESLKVIRTFRTVSFPRANMPFLSFCTLSSIVFDHEYIMSLYIGL